MGNDINDNIRLISGFLTTKDELVALRSAYLTFLFLDISSLIICDIVLQSRC